MSLESVKALSRFIWSWLPDTASRGTIAFNMAATHANCAIFWTLNTVKNFTKRSMEISLTLSNICTFAPQALTCWHISNPLLKKNVCKFHLVSRYSKIVIFYYLLCVDISVIRP